MMELNLLIPGELCIVDMDYVWCGYSSRGYLSSGFYLKKHSKILFIKRENEEYVKFLFNNKIIYLPNQRAEYLIKG